MQLRGAHPPPWDGVGNKKKWGKKTAELNNFAIIQVLGDVDIPKQLNCSWGCLSAYSRSFITSNDSSPDSI